MSVYLPSHDRPYFGPIWAVKVGQILGRVLVFTCPIASGTRAVPVQYGTGTSRLVYPSLFSAGMSKTGAWGIVVPDLDL
jgi:hypothetical protein